MCWRGLFHLSRLDGQGVFEAVHALFQVLDFPLLLGQEEVFDPVQPDLNSVDVLFGSRGLEALIDHRGKLVNGDGCLCHMYSSIAGPCPVSMAGGKGDSGAMGGWAYIHNTPVIYYQAWITQKGIIYN
jgi:hypothetical protein